MLAQFRREIREWIRRTAHDGEWERSLLAANMICPGWPPAHGGSGLSPAEVFVFEEECAKACVPLIHRGVGEHLVGPAILQHGTADQKARFLPRIISGADRYCRAYSEPDHGSDLASATTHGARTGDDLVIHGHKTWVAGAAEANMLCLLCETGGEVCLVLVPMTGEIQIRPTPAMTGSPEFHEVFLHGARVPRTHVIGGVTGSWPPAMTAANPSGLAAANAKFEAEFWELVREARKTGRADDPGVRERLAWAYSRIALIRAHTMRLVTAMSAGENTVALQATERLLTTEFRRHFGEIAIDIAGPATTVQPDEHSTTWQTLFLSSRAATIDPHTSELRRTAIAEEILHLPTSE
ncbi:hypothetical protein ALI144C_31790 [Actinosynnema sp. ALI-1.44]|uniref:acyl-CoA dehydrogenase family protein n=1 Tax=Actinosynnema sp. ALI-1.44 TaxID=1933779 RepID=UPI00097C5A94|nr:acyl-CoA dehydrogenase family protein [Actinosynnema sp. ALI-1.44]ONI77980.1 hypothetical protein ALI144C_31790 [Actinosynnema sp. ALI-1.44]